MNNSIEELEDDGTPLLTLILKSLDLAVKSEALNPEEMLIAESFREGSYNSKCVGISRLGTCIEIRTSGIDIAPIVIFPRDYKVPSLTKVALAAFKH